MKCIENIMKEQNVKLNQLAMRKWRIMEYLASTDVMEVKEK